MAYCISFCHWMVQHASIFGNNWVSTKTNSPFQAFYYFNNTIQRFSPFDQSCPNPCDRLSISNNLPSPSRPFTTTIQSTICRRLTPLLQLPLSIDIFSMTTFLVQIISKRKGYLTIVLDQYFYMPVMRRQSPVFGMVMVSCTI